MRLLLFSSVISSRNLLKSLEVVDCPGWRVTPHNLLISNEIAHARLEDAGELMTDEYYCRREHGPHRALDFEAAVDQPVRAVRSGTVWYGVIQKPEHYKQANLKLITISTYRFTVGMLYVEPKPGLIQGGKVFAGDIVGNAQDIAGHYHARGRPGMTNHVHVDVTARGFSRTQREGRVNPTKYFPASVTGWPANPVGVPSYPDDDLEHSF
jgi:hypothetical protein